MHAKSGVFNDRQNAVNTWHQTKWAALIDAEYDVYRYTFDREITNGFGEKIASAKYFCEASRNGSQEP